MDKVLQTIVEDIFTIINGNSGKSKKDASIFLGKVFITAVTFMVADRPKTQQESLIAQLAQVQSPNQKIELVSDLFSPEEIRKCYLEAIKSELYQYLESKKEQIDTTKMQKIIGMMSLFI